MLCINRTFSITDAHKYGHLSIKNKEFQIQVLVTFAVEQTQSVRKISADLDTSKSTLQDILKKDDDLDHRLIFCKDCNLIDV